MLLIAVGSHQTGFVGVVRDRDGKRNVAECIHRHMTPPEALRCARALLGDVYYLRRHGVGPGHNAATG